MNLANVLSEHCHQVEQLGIFNAALVREYSEPVSGVEGARRVANLRSCIESARRVMADMERYMGLHIKDLRAISVTVKC